jgi:hypothetical protein
MPVKRKNTPKKKRDLRGKRPPVSLRDTNRKAVAQDLPQDGGALHTAKPGQEQRTTGQTTRSS